MKLFNGLFKTKGTKEPPKTKSWGAYNEYSEEIKVDHAETVKERIREQGLEDQFEILLPKPNELQIDYDQHDIPDQFFEMLDVLKQTAAPNEIIEYAVRKSRSGNLHVSIFLPYTLSSVERIAWQAIFGSDCKREALSLCGVALGHKNPTLLVEKIGNKIIDSGFRANIKAEPVGRKFRD